MLYKTRRLTLLGVLLYGLLGCKGTEEVPLGAAPIVHNPTRVPAGVDSVGESIDYTLTLEDAAQHYLKVRAVFPAPATQEIDLSMAVWTPGSYLVREYARHVEDIRFASAKGEPLQGEKVSKNRWRVTTGSDGGLVVEYKLYCFEMSVRSNFVDNDLAVLNGAPTFLTMVGQEQRPHRVTLQLPEGWKPAQTGLPTVANNSFLAKGYDELVDSPIIAGRDIHSSKFQIEGVPHTLVHLGDFSQWDVKKTAADVQKLAETEIRFWGQIPYESYHFLNLILGGRGGLEHQNSTLMLTGVFSAKTPESYRSWLGLVAHEFFHTWNVKRLRPIELGPFDYETETHTRSLWVAEGITSYYDDLLLRRAGLLTDTQYLELLSKQIDRVQSTPGRTVQSLSEASYDAWIKHYRPDENSRNTRISYYTKGAVVGFLLDAEIRIATDNAKSLDTLMRYMYERYSGEKGYTPAQFRAAANDIAGADLSAFFAQTVDSTAELQFDRALQFFGMQFVDNNENQDNDDGDDIGWLGLKMTGDTIARVERDTPAHTAGLSVGDEVIAIDGYRNHQGLSQLLEQFSPAQTVSITISRRGKLRTLSAQLGRPPLDSWTLEVQAKQSTAQTAHRRNWLQEQNR